MVTGQIVEHKKKYCEHTQRSSCWLSQNKSNSFNSAKELKVSTITKSPLSRKQTRHQCNICKNTEQCYNKSPETLDKNVKYDASGTPKDPVINDIRELREFYSTCITRFPPAIGQMQSFDVIRKPFYEQASTKVQIIVIIIAILIIVMIYKL
ncbi:hypothetical protein GJ496_008341 [Pomphorhynchus laevis]|nr:hypothetical protein GJ496_008341 [Pomphorhynchus laevis]